MKKIPFLFLALLCLSCSMTEENKALSLIEQYFKENANDPKSIEILGIDSICDDSASLYSRTALYNFQVQQIKDCESELDKMNEDDVLRKMYEDDLERYKAEFKEDSMSFKPFHNKVVYVRFRGKNALGAVILNRAKVMFDKDITVIKSFDTIR